MAREVREQSVIVAVADRLPGIGSVSLDVRSRGTTGWRGHGRGTVRAVRDAEGVWFEETGRFFPASGRAAMTFRNALCWTIQSDTIVLSHRRHGPAGGTRLVELREPRGARNSFELRSVRPHRCGEDSYAAALLLRDLGFDLVWRVIGPRKDEDLIHRYRVAREN